MLECNIPFPLRLNCFKIYIHYNVILIPLAKTGNNKINKIEVIIINQENKFTRIIM